MTEQCYHVIIDNIWARHMDDTHKVEVTDETNSFTFQVSGLKYANMILNDPTLPETYQNLARALYLYWEAAFEAFGE